MPPGVALAFIYGSDGSCSAYYESIVRHITVVGPDDASGYA